MAPILISYRRETAGGWAYGLASHLEQYFGQDQVFMDVKDIDLGVDFVKAIDDALAQCKVLLVVIDRDWLKVEDEKRRLDNPRDFVRLEIEGALKRKIRIYPVLAPGASMPSTKELPRSLKPLANQNALELSETRLRQDLERLTKSLESVVPRAKASKSTSPAAPSGPVAPPRGTTPVGSLVGFRQARTPGLLTTKGGTAAVFEPDPQEIARRKAETETRLAQWKARAEANEARKARARATAPRFYMLPMWWISLVVNLAACIGAALMSERLTHWLFALVGFAPQTLPFANWFAAALGTAWGVAYSLTGTVVYADDPERGQISFWTRGLLGGWWIAIEVGMEFSVFAFPVSIVSTWLVTHAVSLTAQKLLGFDHAGTLFAVSGAMSYIAAGFYAFIASDEL